MTRSGSAPSSKSVIAAGGVGINIEDGRGAPELLAAKIRAARAAGARIGVPLFINARIDVYLRSLVPPDQAVAEVIRRAGMYREAGADGAFPAGIVQPGRRSAPCPRDRHARQRARRGRSAAGRRRCATWASRG